MPDHEGSLDPEREWVYKPLRPGDFDQKWTSIESYKINKQRWRRKGMLRGFLRHGIPVIPKTINDETKCDTNPAPATNPTSPTT